MRTLTFRLMTLAALCTLMMPLQAIAQDDSQAAIGVAIVAPNPVLVTTNMVTVRVTADTGTGNFGDLPWNWTGFYTDGQLVACIDNPVDHAVSTGIHVEDFDLELANDLGVTTPGIFTIGAFQALSSLDCQGWGGSFPPEATVDMPVFAITQFTVSKVYSDDNTAPVSVAAQCDEAQPTQFPIKPVVTNNPQNAAPGAPAVFNVRSLTPNNLNCRATEGAPPVGYTKDERDCQPAGPRNRACTITNNQIPLTLRVAKEFSDNNPVAVTITLKCSAGVTINPGSQLQASMGAPAEYTVSGFKSDGSSSCSATESGVAGYTPLVIGCDNMPLVLAGTPACEFQNNQDTVNVTVQKDFSDNNTGSVPVNLACDGGATVTVNKGSASEASAASFTVSNFPVGGSTCKATETVPNGYTESANTCGAVAINVNGPDQTCKITNTQNPVKITVAKDFSDDNPMDVAVALTCNGGTVSIDDGTASESDAANFTVSNFPFTGTSCQATETIPAGYTANQTACNSIAVALGGAGNCTIVNTLNTATFRVSKDFLDDSTMEVPVALTCSSGTTNPGNASVKEGDPQSLTIEGFNTAPNGSTNCTVTEITPDGYEQLSASADCSVNGITQNGSYTCTFTNALPTATFKVNKDFSDNNPMEVAVTLSCDTGQILDQTKMIKEGTAVTFVVTDFEQGKLDCSVTEEAITGYTAAYTNNSQGGTNAASCAYTNVSGGNADECTIRNNLDDVKVRVTKKWIDANPTFQSDQVVEVELWCTPKGGSARSLGEQKIYPSPGYTDYTFKPSYLTETCAVSEMEGEDFVADVSDCVGLMVAPGVGDACTVENTRLYEGIPTLSQYGLAILALLMLGVGMVGFRRFV